MLTQFWENNGLMEFLQTIIDLHSRRKSPGRVKPSGKNYVTLATHNYYTYWCWLRPSIILGHEKGGEVGKIFRNCRVARLCAKFIDRRWPASVGERNMVMQTKCRTAVARLSSSRLVCRNRQSSRRDGDAEERKDDELMQHAKEWKWLVQFVLPQWSLLIPSYTLYDDGLCFLSLT